MDTEVPYLASVKNLHAILDAIKNGAVPEAFGLDFLKDLGFTSSNDRAVIKLLKFLGMLDSSGRPQSPYREFVDHTKSKSILAARVAKAYDDLFASDRNAHTKNTTTLKGWFKTKTGVGEAVATKMASTFKSLASYADFTGAPVEATNEDTDSNTPEVVTAPEQARAAAGRLANLGLSYRIEVHLPDTSNVDTFRAIFKALREELM